MRPVCEYFNSLIVIIKNKFIYGKRFNTGMLQSFQKFNLDVGEKGCVRMGSFNQNRGTLYICVPKGTLTIGSHCFFNINSSITCMESITIGDNCKFGNNLVIVDHDHNFRDSTSEFVSTPITIGNNVWCGANVVILRGTTIGDNCVISAGTVLRGKIPAGSIVYQKRETTISAIN